MLAKSISTSISETVNHIETLSKKLGLSISETVTHSESMVKSISKTISETANHTEIIAKSIAKTISEVVSHNETITKSVSTTISEVVTHSETLLKKISFTIAETVTHSEVLTRKIMIVISETATHVESIAFDIFGRLRGIIGMVKEFVRISDKKEKVSAINVQEGAREELNNPYRQYDDATLLYDEEGVCYNNYISSEKPIFALSKKYNNVSVSSQKDKPGIAKK